MKQKIHNEHCSCKSHDLRRQGFGFDNAAMKKEKMIKNKSIIYLILLILVVSSVSATNVSLNYVWDGTDWIPWLATADGRPKIDLNKVNVTAGKLVVDTNLLYVDEVNDFVGFRTAAPAATLDVIGNISVRGGVLFVDNESQRVGINTTTPTAELHVIGDVNISGRLDVGILNISGVTFAGGNIDTGNITASYFLGDGSLMSGLTNASVNYGWDGSSNIPYKLSGDGTLQMDIINDIADDLACTDCIGAEEITDVYVLNSGDFVDGTLGVGGVLNATGLNITGTEENATFMGDVQVFGTLYGGSPLKIGGGVNVTGGNFSVNESVFFVDTTNDRVGMGTSSPGIEFEVEGGVNISGGLNVTNGDVLLATSSGNVVIGNATPTTKLHVEGSLNVTKSIFIGENLTSYGADLAEKITVKGRVSAGDVLVIDEYDDETLRLSEIPYSTNVAGIVSTDPSFIMSEGTDGEVIALAGRVPVKVTGENGAISRGDLLTTSSTPGHAMKFTLLNPEDASDFDELKSILKENQQRRNSILGKALEPCYDETCKIMALITLQ